jgi:hypothetical protein
VHCDANSRNFLFDGTTLEAPDGLQIVDCGGYKEFAPLVFDLAQLEADLKFVLMGSEKDSGYDEINPAVLKSKWVLGSGNNEYASFTLLRHRQLDS